MRYIVATQGDVRVLRVLHRRVGSASYFVVETSEKRPVVAHQGAGAFLLMTEHPAGAATALRLPVEANCRVVAQTTRYGFEALAVVDAAPEAAMDVIEEEKPPCYPRS